MIKEGRFVEWAEVYGNLYGTAREAVEEPLSSGLDLLFDVDIQGGRKIKAAFSEAILIFVAPPSLNELAQRLKRRNKDSEEHLRLRLKESKEELQAVWHYNYVVVNDQFEDALERMKAIIAAERCRVIRRRNLIETLLQQPIPSLKDAE
jgi:guanylate kinase